MTIRDIGILFGYKLDKASENKVESSVQSLKSMAAKALGAIGITLSVAGISAAITDCVSLASEVEEMENKFDVVFGNIRDEVDAWAQDYSDAIGRNKNDIKTYLADQQNLLVGFGMTREEGAKLSEQMTSLALDLASFGNMDEATSVNAMTKAVMGESEAAKTLGAVLNDTTRAQAMQTLGLTGTYDALDQLTKMQVNYQAILSQSPDAIGDCERSLSSYQSTLRRFQSKLKEIKTLIGQFFMPTFQKVISFGAKGLTVLRDWLQKLNAFADEVGGAEQILAVLGAALAGTLLILNAQKIMSAVAAFRKMAGALGLSAAKAALLFAAILIVALIIQDFVAFMKGDNSVIGTLFDKAGIGADNARQAIINAWNAIKSFLSNVWNAIKSLAHSVFEALAAWWAENGEQVKASFQRIWEAIKTIAETLWNALVQIATTIFSALQVFWEQWGSTIISVFQIIWDTLIALIQLFLDALTALIEFVANVFTGNWQGAWENVKQICSAVWEAIKIIIQGAWNALLSIWSGLAAWFSSIWESAKAAVVAKIGEIRNSIVTGFQAAISYIQGLASQAYQWGADIISGIVNGIRSKISAVGDAVAGVANKVKSFLHFSEPDEGPLSDFHTYMPDMMSLMAQGIIAGKEKVKAALGDVTGDMSVMAKANVVSKATVSGMTGSNYSSRNVTQNVNIHNEFKGDRAGQQKSSEAMNRASDDATSEMARALAFAR